MITQRFSVMCLIAIGLWGAQTASAQNNWYVSPAGQSTNAGTVGSPWDLATAFYGGRVTPGSTVWLRGGTYAGPVSSWLTGSATSPITVRPYANEQVIFRSDAARGNWGILNIYGAYTTYRDFEVMDGNTDRGYSSDFRPIGVQVQGPYTKIVNFLIHDTGMGIALWSSAVNAELYGNLIYNSGSLNTMSDKRHGHAIYVQSATGTAQIRDNILFDQFGWGIHAYGSPLANIEIDGNVIFNSGVLSGSIGPINNILVSSDSVPASGIKITNNYTYQSLTQNMHGTLSDADLCLGCTHPVSNVDIIVTDNYFAGGAPAAIVGLWSQMSVLRNTFVGKFAMTALVAPKAARSSFAWNSNSYIGTNIFNSKVLFATVEGAQDFAGWQALGLDTSSQFLQKSPTGSKVVLRKNAYDANRATLAIYNWDLSPTATVDLSSFLRAGAHYEIRNVQNLSVVVGTGIYVGAPVSVSLSAVSATAPLGWTTPAATGPEFNTFIVRQY